MGDFKNGIISLDSCLLLRKKILHNDSTKSNIRNYANTLTVIGTVYADLARKLSNKSEIKQNCNEANYYFNQAKIFFEKIGDKSLIALVYGNISSVYLILENYDKAYENTIKDLNTNLSINSYLDVADAKIELSEIYILKKEYDSALIELKNAKKMLELNHLELKISDEYEFYENFGSVYDSLKKYNNALLFYNKAYNVALEINSLLWIENMSNILYKTYKKLGKNKKALNMYKSYILNRDSLRKMQAIEETMAMELERKYELKKQEDSIRNFEKKKLDQANLALKKTQLKEEKSFTIGVGILLVAIIVFAILIFLIISLESNYLFAFLLFFLAGITDYLDGLLARKYNASSDIGEILDPIADKILIIFILFGLAVNLSSYLIGFMSSIIISREIWVSALRDFSARKNISNATKVTFLAKVKTSVQLFTIFLYL